MQQTEHQKTTTSEMERIRWAVGKEEDGPVLVIFAGIHGNETAGVHAIDHVAATLLDRNVDLKGKVYGITGNMKALELGVRYIDTDLNRIWETGYKKGKNSHPEISRHSVEFKESLEIKNAVEWILEKHQSTASKFVFIDLHTTSSESCAFILLNDTLANRQLARKFPVPQILGIEENIHGTLLSYINNLGHLSVGFEAGAHTDEASIKRSKAFLWLALYWLEMIKLTDSEVQNLEDRLDIHPEVPDKYYEVKYHKIVEDNEKFRMLEGFQNFDRVEKGTPLARENGEVIEAPRTGRIFMPLYQKKGRDGFLIIREVSPFWLWLSGYLRRSFVHKLLQYLPGVSIQSNQAFKVNLRVARFLVKDIFHLFGYRVVRSGEYTLICYKR